MLFDWLVTGQVLPINPAASVKAPKHVVKKGKTPVLSADEARAAPRLDRHVATSSASRDRALIGVMVFSFARIWAVLGMKVEDYYPNGKRWWLRLHEKGGKFHEVPAHHNAEAYLDAYIEAAGIAGDRKGPLFRSPRGRNRRAHAATACTGTTPCAWSSGGRRRGALDAQVCCHTFRATGITAYLEAGGTIEKAQQIAAHESPKTTKLYDRTSDQITLDEIERIAI